MRSFPSVRSIVAFALLTLCLAGCESVTEGFGAQSAAEPAAVNPSAELLLPFVLSSAAEGVDQASLADVRDGARLAVEELGEGMVGLQYTDSRGQPQLAQNAYLAAGRNSLPLALGWVGAAEAAALPQEGGVAAIGLAPEGAGQGERFYNIHSGEAACLLAALDAVLAAGRKNVLLLVPQGSPSAHALVAGIGAKGGKLVATVEYPAEAGAARAALEAAREAFARADTFAVAGKGAGVVIDILADIEPALAQKAIVATPAVLQAPPKVQHNGIVVAALDPEARKGVAERFQSRFGRPASDYAAYGYDLVAVAIGLSRTGGGTDLPALLTSAAGFRGATGIFRFAKDGSVDRLLRVGVVRDGAFAPVDTSPKGF